MKRIIKIFSFLAISLLLSGCATKDSMENINIYTSIYPIEYVTNVLYGDYANIISMYPNNVNPYEYKLTDKQINNYSNADLIVYNGLDKETDYVVKMLNNNKRLKIIDSTAKIEYENGLDEIWINPSNMITIAQNTRNGLKEYINSNYLQGEIETNYEKLKLEFSTLDANLKETVENAKDINIIVADDDLNVLSKYGLNIVSIDEDNLTDKELADAKNLLSKKTVSYIFVKKDYKETKTMKDLKDTYGIEYLKIDTLNNLSDENKDNNKDYISVMNDNIDNLKKELY